MGAEVEVVVWGGRLVGRERERRGGGGGEEAEVRAGFVLRFSCLLPRAQEQTLTGFLESSTSRMLRFSRGMIPRGSLSWDRHREKGFTLHGGNTSCSSLGPP